MYRNAHVDGAHEQFDKEHSLTSTRPIEKHVCICICTHAHTKEGRHERRTKEMRARWMVVCACQVFVDLRASERARERERHIESEKNRSEETAIGRLRARKCKSARTFARESKRG